MNRAFDERINILVIMPTFYPSMDANTQCVIRILSNSKIFRYTVMMEQETGMKVSDMVNDIKIIRYPKRSLRQDIVHRDMKSCLYNLPLYVISKIRNRYNFNDVNYDRVQSFLLEYNRLIDIKEYSAIVGFMNPIESLLIVSKMRRKHQIAAQVMYFDPYFSNETKSVNGFKRRKKLEQKVLGGLVDRVLLTGFVYRDFCKYDLKVDPEKLFINELPGIRFITPPDVWVENRQDGITNCYFIGNLYWKIRNPISLLNAFSKMPDDIQLFFVGGCFDGDIMELLDNAGVRIPDNVHFVGKVTPQKAEEYLWSADVLVNLGNTTCNQLPSKVFDYMSIGKPILNIKKTKSDPSIPYFQKYPLSLTVEEKDLSDEKYIGKIVDFCRDNGGKRILLDDIKRDLPEVTVEYVKEKFEDNLSQIL